MERQPTKGHWKLLWSDEDIAYLREHYPVSSASDIADHFGISLTSVSLKAYELGLKKSPNYSSHQYRNRYVRNYVNANNRRVNDSDRVPFNHF